MDSDANGIRDLFLGRSDETDQQRAGREQAARDVHTELTAHSDNDGEIDELNALYVAYLAELMLLLRLWRQVRAGLPSPARTEGHGRDAR
ncbi:hypothetical protein ACH41E_09190 [Streptomyces sp. NPDC020412]|uniref:hypothetical protein n=1 Tax=Streptomyces sp. NPDC020412 TaxID=3365073 RepID=UPI00378F5558